MPQAFAELAPAGPPQVHLPEAPAKLTDIPAPEWSAASTVRHSDHDFNNHVNNAHYVAWTLECLPDAWLGRRRAREIDIAFRAAAHWGDTVTAEAAHDAGDADTLLHRIRRDSDGALLAQARTVWSEPS